MNAGPDPPDKFRAFFVILSSASSTVFDPLVILRITSGPNIAASVTPITPTGPSGDPRRPGRDPADDTASHCSRRGTASPGSDPSRGPAASAAGDHCATGAGIGDEHSHWGEIRRGTLVAGPAGGAR